MEIYLEDENKLRNTTIKIEKSVYLYLYVYTFRNTIACILNTPERGIQFLIKNLKK